MSAERSSLSLKRWRRRFAELLLATLFAVTTRSSSAQSDVLVKLTSLSLNPIEQENLANYIRRCEVERKVSDLRLKQLSECGPASSPSSLEFFPLIVVVLVSGALGYTLGAHSK